MNERKKEMRREEREKDDRKRPVRKAKRGKKNCLSESKKGEEGRKEGCAINQPNNQTLFDLARRGNFDW